MDESPYEKYVENYDYSLRIKNATSIKELQSLWIEMRTAGVATPEILKLIQARLQEFYS